MTLSRSALPDRASRSLDLVDRHGSALLLLARALVGDAQQAETEVAAVLGSAGHLRRMLRDEPTRAELAASLVRQCGLEMLAGPDRQRPGSEPAPDDDPTGLLAELPARVRVTLALCVYGAQSCAETALLLDRPQADVAADLLTGLRQVAARRVAQNESLA